MEMIRRSGQQGVPVVTTADEVILGFDQARLARLADKYGAPKRPPLGLLGADAESYLSRHPGAAAGAPADTKGVFVGEVRPGSVAARAGVAKGDIIVALAGKRVRNLSGMDQLVAALKAGEAVSARYLRAGESQTTTFQF